MVSLKEKRLHQIKTMNCGSVCEIIEYVGANNITVKFESGKIVKNKSYLNFIKGTIREFSDKEHSELRIGKTRMMNCGMKATIIKYVDSTNIDVKFEDGYISKNKYYKKFLDGGIHNKNIEYKNFVDLTGQKFGRWTVLYKDLDRIKEKHKNNKENGSSNSIIYWICECECGNKGSVDSGNLKNGTSRSCGCLESELTIQRNIEQKSYLGSLSENFPELSKLLEDSKDGNISIGSSRKVKAICPKCGEPRVYSVDCLVKHGFSCFNCSSKVSYPNRFMYKFLKQLNLEFESEKIFDWSDRKRYDFYLPKYNMIIEAHGKQHYVDCSWSSADDQIKNDRYKEQIAKENGIKIYLQLDCRYSYFKYIKKSIEQSNLSNMFNFNSIDWEAIEEELQINIKEVER